MKLVNIFVYLFFLASCQKENVLNNESTAKEIPKALIGKWKAVSLFLSDASTGVCHANTPTRDIIIEFKNEKSTDDQSGYIISGNSTVNTYFSTVNFISFNSSENKAAIKINSIATTKMAGSPEMMDCEQNYYTFLAESTGIQFFSDDPNTIHIGRLKEPDSNPRDGGTYFVFEKIPSGTK
jgi:META domain